MSDARHPQETMLPRMATLARLPLFFVLEGKRALLAGGGAAAAWKAELLAASGARVDVYAEDISDAMTQIAREVRHGAIMLHRREWSQDDFKGCAIAVGNFNADAQAGAFCAAAHAAGVPVNVIDMPTFGDFSFGAIVNRSPLVVSISTDGAAPVFAQAIRAKLEALLPKGFSAWATAAAAWRKAVNTSTLSFRARRRFWQLFTAHAIANPDQTPTRSNFDSFLAEVKGLGDAVAGGSVVLVGAGPGDPELLTLRAVRALQAADVILFDDLVSREVFDFARREAKKLLVGKTGHGPSCKQDEINALMVSLARRGKCVVRLKGGDPLIFGRATEEIAACRAARIPVEIVPGISAAQGAAARLTLPLTGRGQARRLQYVTGHALSGALPDDIDWAGLADPAATTAIYMPAKTLSALVARAMAAGLDPQTPALAIARATRPDQAHLAAPISELPQRLAQGALHGPVLVLFGNVIADAAACNKENISPRIGGRR